MFNKIKQFWTGNKRAKELFARLQAAQSQLNKKLAENTELQVNFINQQNINIALDEANKKLASENRRLTSQLGKKQAKVGR